MNLATTLSLLTIILSSATVAVVADGGPTSVGRGDEERNRRIQIKVVVFVERGIPTNDDAASMALDAAAIYTDVPACELDVTVAIVDFDREQRGPPDDILDAIDAIDGAKIGIEVGTGAKHNMMDVILFKLLETRVSTMATVNDVAEYCNSRSRREAIPEALFFGPETIAILAEERRMAIPTASNPNATVAMRYADAMMPKAYAVDYATMTCELPDGGGTRPFRQSSAFQPPRWKSHVTIAEWERQSSPSSDAHRHCDKNVVRCVYESVVEKMRSNGSSDVPDWVVTTESYYEVVKKFGLGISGFLAQILCFPRRSLERSAKGDDDDDESGVGGSIFAEIAGRSASVACGLARGAFSLGWWIALVVASMFATVVRGWARLSVACWSATVAALRSRGGEDESAEVDDTVTTTAASVAVVFAASAIAVAIAAFWCVRRTRRTIVAAVTGRGHGENASDDDDGDGVEIAKESTWWLRRRRIDDDRFEGTNQTW